MYIICTAKTQKNFSPPETGLQMGPGCKQSALCILYRLPTSLAHSLSSLLQNDPSHIYTVKHVLLHYHYVIVFLISNCDINNCALEEIKAYAYTQMNISPDPIALSSRAAGVTPRQNIGTWY
jgi:hypothetical protein